MTQSYKWQVGFFSFIFETSAWPLEHLYNNFLFFSISNNAVLLLLGAYIWETIETVMFHVIKLTIDPGVVVESTGDIIVGDIWSAVFAIAVGMFVSWRTNNFFRESWGVVTCVKKFCYLARKEPLRVLLWVFSMAGGRLSFWIIGTHGNERQYGILVHGLFDTATVVLQKGLGAGMWAHPLRVSVMQVHFVVIWHVTVYLFPVAHVSLVVSSILVAMLLLMQEMFIPHARRRVAERHDPEAILLNAQRKNLKAMLDKAGAMMKRGTLKPQDIATWTDNSRVALAVDAIACVGGYGPDWIGVETGHLFTTDTSEETSPVGSPLVRHLVEVGPVPTMEQMCGMEDGDPMTMESQRDDGDTKSGGK